MSTPDAGDTLVAQPSPRGQLPTTALIGAFLGSYVLLGLLDVISPGLMWLGVAVFGAAFVSGCVAIWKASRSSWEIRLDRLGVTVRGHETTPWSDILEVRVTGLRPKWLFCLSFGYRVVAFVGRPGVDLPVLPSANVGGFSGSARLQMRWYGTRLLLMPYAFDVSVDDVSAAVSRFGHVPVVRG